MTRAIVIDQLNPSDLRVIAEFESDDAEQKAVELVSQLKDVETGRYGIDLSEFCDNCGEWHHEDADCVSNDQDLETYGVGWPE